MIYDDIWWYTSITRTRRGGSCLKDIYKTFLIYRTCTRRAPAKPVRACTLRNWCRVAHVTFEAPRHTSHLTVFTLHTAPFAINTSLHTVLLRLHTSHFTLHSSHSKLHTSQSTLHTALFALQTSHFTVHTSHFSLLTASFTLQTSHCILHAPHLTLHSSHPTLHLIWGGTKSRMKRPQPHPPHTRGTLHRRLQPLSTEKHKVSCSGFLPTR